MPTPQSPMEDGNSLVAGNINLTALNCGACSAQLGLYTLLPKPLLTATRLEQDLYSNQETYWECASCGASYMTATIVLNLPVLDGITTQTKDSAHSALTRWAETMLTMLRDTYITGSTSEEVVSGKKSK